MQLRHPTQLTAEQYAATEAWRDASLDRCPNHPDGGCSLARHGTYTRKTPPNICIARWYCRESHTTFNPLPDCLPARLPGSLDALETVVAHAERSESLTAAARALRRDAIDLPGAIRWVRRRVRLLRRLLAVADLLPERLSEPLSERLRSRTAGIAVLRARLGTDRALMALHRLLAPRLPALPMPLGFQHKMGHDPPPPRAYDREAWTAMVAASMHAEENGFH